MDWHRGDWVEVRSKEEILRTLDAHGRLDGMPFMPEMFAFCGQKLKISAIAHKTCDTVNWSGNRALPESVHLEAARCNGAAHAGCQAGCLLFWKHAWLKPVGAPAAEISACGAVCTEEAVQSAVHADDPDTGEIRYRCQATDLPLYTQKLRNLDPRQYVRDLATGNTTPGQMIASFAYFAYDFIGRMNKPAWGAPFRWVYDRWAGITGGLPYPRKPGLAPAGKPQPISKLNLQAGDLVRVKSYEEILKTLDRKGHNRGMLFDAELVPYCGGVFRVRSRVETFLDEKTGAVRTLKTPAIILENVWCRSHFSDRRLFCPRAIYSWWREAWLERAPEGAEPSMEGCLGARAILKDMALTAP
jgi:hypothetical protein